MIRAIELIEGETMYGGLHHAPRRTVSPHDPRTALQRTRGFMQGGDRMQYHAYADAYAEHLPANPRVLVELGILRGTGLALWCDIFPHSRVIGLDVDVSHYQENRTNLIRRGAFRKNQPDVVCFDELADDNQAVLSSILAQQRIDVFIDDALHYPEAILRTLALVGPFMAEGGVYFIEDNATVYTRVRELYPNLKIFSRGELTILRF